MSDSDKQALIDGSATIQTKIEVHSENLFEPFDATFNNNITFTYSIDGYINCNGTTTATAYSMTSVQAGNYLISLPSGTYTISGGTSDINIHVVNSSGTVLANTSGTATFTLSQTTNVFVRATISSGKTLNNVKVYPILEEGTPVSLTETNSVIDWNHEDFRLVKEEGWIGQFVARQVTGNLKDLSDDFSITDKELELKLGVRTNDNTNWYSLGNFLVTKVTNDEVNDKTSFEALDYTKKFNKAYVDRITYPCTAGDLAQDVCDQCGVELGSTTFKNSDYVIQGNAFTNNESCRDVMKAIGKLAFSWVRVDWDNKVYIDFNPLPFKNQFDKDNANVNSWTVNSSTKKIESSTQYKMLYIQCKPSTTYTISKIASNYLNVYTTSGIPQIGDVCILSTGATSPYTNITVTTSAAANYLLIRYWRITDTVTEQEILDSIMIEEQPSQYETFGNNKYYNLKTQKEVFGPVDKVVIGYSAIEGERTYIGEENGTCVLNIFDNPLVFNQEQRAAIIESASDLLGFTYTPLNTLTVGHPWLKGNEIVRVTDMESVSHDTIPFDRTIQYFGHIKTLINSTTETKTNDNLSYKPEMVKNYERSEIYNDQINKQIGIIIEEQTDTSNRLNETISTLDGTIQRVSNTETSINDITTTTQVSTGKNSLYLEDTMEGNALSYSVDGTTEQDGTPTPDNPIDVKTIPSIINLCGIPNQTFTYNGVDVTIQDGEITLNGTATATGTKQLQPINLTTLNGTYTDSITYISGTSPTSGTYFNFNIRNANGGSIINGTQVYLTTGSENKTFTVSEDTSIIYGLYVYNGKTYTNFKFKPMLEIGSTRHEYVPYGYYSKVKVTGKNIFDKEKTNWYRNDKYTFSDTTNTSTTRIRTNSFPIEGGKTYTVSGIPSGISLIIINEFEEYGGTRTSYVYPTNNSFTLAQNTKYIHLRFGGSNFTDDTNTLMANANIQLEQNNQATTYEPYKENQVLIDMSKENLCPSTNVELGRYNVDTGEKETATTAYRNNDFVPTKPNQIYTFNIENRKTNLLFRWFYYDNNKTLLSTDTSSTGNFTTPNDCYYVNWHSTALKDSYPNNIPNTAIYEGNNPTPYYELCKIGDYKDTLSIDSSGNVVVNKNVGKVVLNGSESWEVQWASDGRYGYKVNIPNIKQTTSSGNIPNLFCNYYMAHTQDDVYHIYSYSICRRTNQSQIIIRNDDQTSLANFKTWLSTHNTSIYYVLNTPETINLPNTKIPLFDGINHVTFVDDLETDTKVSYYRNTPLSGTYATLTQLNEVSTEKTQEIQTVRNEVQTEISSTQASIQVINETIENGVSKVNGTGYTFDSEGLKIEKTNQDVKSLLDNDGLAVSYKDTDLLTVRSNGIEAENMTVRKFYVQRPIRMEKTKSISDGSSVGLGFFYVGEE